MHDSTSVIQRLPAATSFERFYLPFTMGTGLLFLSLLFLLVPVEEWLLLLPYLAFLILIAFLIYPGVKRVDPTFSVAFFLFAFSVKLISSLGRYWMVTGLYRTGDAYGYHSSGQELAQFFLVGDFSVLETYRFKGEGTTWMAHLTGLVYTFMPPSMAGSFLLFGGLAFAGSVFFYCAFRIALAGEESRWYRLLVFFLPSILFWPASLGKDSWMYFCTGIVTLGWAKYAHQARLSGLLGAGIGLILIEPIRAHVSAFLALSMGGAFFLSSTRGQRSIATWVAGGVLLAGLGGVMVQSGADFLHLDDLSVDAVEGFYDAQQDKTFGGGSDFTPPNIFNPIGAVYGIISVLFRPFPWEAHNAQAIVTALESLGWLAIIWLRRRVFLERLKLLHRKPLLTFALLYSLLLSLGLTIAGNFGIIARQRPMFLPLFWMLFG